MAAPAQSFSTSCGRMSFWSTLLSWLLLSLKFGGTWTLYARPSVAMASSMSLAPNPDSPKVSRAHASPSDGLSKFCT